MLSFRIAIFLLLGLLLSSASYAEQSIIKVYNNDAGGVQTETLVFNSIRQEMADLHILQENAGIERSLRNIQMGDGLCARNLVKNNERSQYLTFTKPTTYFLGLQAYVMPGTQITVRDGDDFGTIIRNNPKVIVGIEHERSYGDNIDLILNSLESRFSLYEKHGPENAGQIHSMLIHGRVDLILEYPSVMAFYNNRAHVPKEQQPVAINVKDFPTLVSGHIACKNSPLGLRFVEQVNAAMERIKGSESFLKWHLDYIPKPLHQEFRTRLSEITAS